MRTCGLDLKQVCNGVVHPQSICACESASVYMELNEVTESLLCTRRRE